MTMNQRVITLFHESIEAKMQVGEGLAPLIEEASRMIVHALLDGKKLLICGNGVSAANGQVFTSSLVNRFEQERPSLPAVALGNDVTTQTSIANDYSFNEIYAKQIRALGQAGDLLVILSGSGNPSNLVPAIGAAHDREMAIIALTGRDSGNISALLDVNDIELHVPVDSLARIHEIHLLIIFCLCDLIDHQLFGVQES
nr:SIS domain-containing protein [Exilibacterium tricleocarpae]